MLAAVPGARRALEAGTGTGKATVALARRGLEIDALEPDAAMAAVARRTTRGLPVAVHVTRLEDWAGPAAAFDLVACAQAWHWVDTASAAAVAARALRPGGALALWWNRPDRVEGPVFEALKAAYRREAPALEQSTSLLTVRTAEDAEPAPLPGFGPWQRRSFPWTQVYDATAYGELISTQPDHRLLPADRLTRLVEAVRAAIDEAGGGRLECAFRTDLLLARPLTGRPEVRL